jgi:hypothetical protein
VERVELKRTRVNSNEPHFDHTFDTVSPRGVLAQSLLLRLPGLETKSGAVFIQRNCVTKDLNRIGRDER